MSKKALSFNTPYRFRVGDQETGDLRIYVSAKRNVVFRIEIVHAPAYDFIVIDGRLVPFDNLYTGSMDSGLKFIDEHLFTDEEDMCLFFSNTISEMSFANICQSITNDHEMDIITGKLSEEIRQNIDQDILNSLKDIGK